MREPITEKTCKVCGELKPITEFDLDASNKRSPRCRTCAVCSVDGCGRKSAAKGLCKKHWTKARAEDPDAPICSIAGCSEPVRSNDLCSKHYQRNRTHGNPLTTLRVVVQGEESQRFWAKVNKGGPTPERRPDLGPCWVWTASLSNKGYAQFRSEGTMVLAHRLLWQRVNGPIPEGLELDHLCRNPVCVRPSHLEPVTHQVNVQRGDATTGVCSLCGKPFDEVLKGGVRSCRDCRLARKRAFYYRHRERILAQQAEYRTRKQQQQKEAS